MIFRMISGRVTRDSSDISFSDIDNEINIIKTLYEVSLVENWISSSDNKNRNIFEAYRDIRRIIHTRSPNSWCPRISKINSSLEDSIPWKYFIHYDSCWIDVEAYLVGYNIKGMTDSEKMIKLFNIFSESDLQLKGLVASGFMKPKPLLAIVK